MQCFPAFLKLAGRRTVVVGGSAVAASKVRALLDASADVVVVAPEVSANIKRAGVSVVQRAFEPADLDDAWLVVAAATPDVNRQVARAAENRRVSIWEVCSDAPA